MCKWVVETPVQGAALLQEALLVQNRCARSHPRAMSTLAKRVCKRVVGTPCARGDLVQIGCALEVWELLVQGVGHPHDAVLVQSGHA
mgnify:CR=1 FL=1